uniref:Coat protein n=1 Tax=Pepino mosaic virus TaxID=112229 RepID=T2KFA2_9VIRU|nr:coat protein [Pepino mosaic virus]
MTDTTPAAATSGSPPTAQDAGAKAPADFSNPNTAPSLSDLKKVKYVSTVTSVATPTEIEALGKIFTAMGLAANETGPAMWDLARAYADVQSSKSAQLIGATPSNPALSRRALAAQFDRINITPRQFCMYFAKVVWNILLDSNIPPANWAKLGYQEDTKFAAFDFFDGVTNPASLQPADGLIRQPNEKELAAHSVAKYGALARQKISSGNYITTLGEVTRGHMGGANTMYAIDAPPELKTLEN